MEILVALVLIVLVLGLTLSDSFSPNKALDEEVTKIERAVRFMSDEAALRNTVIRLHFLLDKEPQEYAVEYGPSESFVLPPSDEFETTTVSKEDEEKAKKATKDTNLKFNRIQEFQESNQEISSDVKIIGYGSSSSKKLKTTGEVSLYAFPSGEKDDAIIILATEESIVSLAVSAFNQKIDKKTYPLDNISNRDIKELQEDKAKEIFETWLKDK